MSARKIYPKVVIQTCTNHYKENIRKTLSTRTQEKYQPFIRQIEGLFKKKRSDEDYNKRAGLIYEKWKYDRLTRNILLDMVKRTNELRAWTKVRHTPQTTNLIEAYNKHLKARVKPLQGFQTFQHADLWINGYILKRRTTPFTDCKGKFRKLNGHSSLELALQDNKTMPNFFN
jgi:transposase-like protein